MTAGPVEAVPAPLRSDIALPIDLDDSDLDTPAVLVDLDVVEANIADMQAFADAEGFTLRPHVKSHKSLTIADRQLRSGAHGVCVATGSEAAVMAGTEAEDVLVAYPLSASASSNAWTALQATVDSPS